MASIHYYQLFFLCQVWHSICGAADDALQVVAVCNEDVLLPCKTLQDIHNTTGIVSWYKVFHGLSPKNESSLYFMGTITICSELGSQECKTGENREDLKNLQHNTEHGYSRELNDSWEIINDTWHYLKIKNITGYSTGIYKCILRTQVNNQSSIIALKVIDCPEQSQDVKLKQYKTELVLLCFLGGFYLLLIFFAFTCFQEKGSPGYYKSRMKHTNNRFHLVNISSDGYFDSPVQSSICKETY